jgi:hypothetical protein
VTPLNLSCIAGDSFIKTFIVNNSDGTPYDFTDCSARMQIKNMESSIDSKVSLSSNDNGITLSEGQILVMMTPEQTQLQPKSYVYDMEITFPSNQVQTWFGGKFIITGDVTR